MSLKEEPETLTVKQTSIMLQVVLKGNRRFLGLCDFESEILAILTMTNWRMKIH